MYYSVAMGIHVIENNVKYSGFTKDSKIFPHVCMVRLQQKPIEVLNFEASEITRSAGLPECHIKRGEYDAIYMYFYNQIRAE